MKKPRVLFIYPDTDGFTISFSPALQILSGFLKAHGIEVSLLHLHESAGIPFDLDLVAKKVSDTNPDLVGITATTSQFSLSDRIALTLKKRGIDCPIVLGGVHATICPEDLGESFFDGFCVGEGELPLLDLCMRLKEGSDVKSTPGFIFKDEEGVIENPAGSAIEDLDSLPLRDFDIIDTEKILSLRNKWLSISFSRGCTYSCSFCINQKLRKIFRRSECARYFRINSAGRIISDLDFLAKKYEGFINVINFDDDLLMADREWFLDLLEQYEIRIFRKYGIKYAVNGRADLLDGKIMESLAKSGCDLLRIGLETGLEELRNGLLSKSVKDEQLFDTFAESRKHNIRTCAFAMLGIPNESKKSVDATISILRRLKPDLIRLPFFEPFPGTALYDYCVKNGLIKDGEKNRSSFSEPGIILNEINESEIIRIQRLFPWFLNADFVPEPFSARYRELVRSYGLLQDTAWQSHDIFDRVIAENEAIASELRRNNIGHFTFYSVNKLYFQYVPRRFSI